MRTIQFISFLFLAGILATTTLGQEYKNSSEIRSKAEAIVHSIHEPVIPDFTINIKTLGAKGDGKTDDRPVIKKAIAKLEKNGGGRIIIPAGEYLLKGAIHFTNNMELHLEKDARIFFSSEPQDYLPVVKTSWEGTFIYNYSPFIYAANCKNIAITGQGTIDGEASDTWNNWHEKQKDDQLLTRKMNHNNTPVEERIFGEGHFLRPPLIQFMECENVLVEGVNIEDAPFWCVHLLLCNSVTVRGINYNAQNKNNDGIDPEYSTNVLIEHVTFNNGDDNVAIKAGRDDEGRSATHGTENIVIRNCHFKGLHAVVVGSEMSAGVKNVFVYDCDFAGDLKRGIYLKSNPDRGGFIQNIYIDNVHFGKVEDGIYITSFYHNEGEGHVTDFGQIYFSNISIEEATGTGVVLQGFTDKELSGIYFNNVDIKKAANGLSMQHTKNIDFSNVTIGEPATAPSFVK